MSKFVKLRVAGKETYINLDTVIKMEDTGQYKTRLTTIGTCSSIQNIGTEKFVIVSPYEIWVDNSIDEILKM